MLVILALVCAWIVYIPVRGNLEDGFRSYEELEKALKSTQFILPTEQFWQNEGLNFRGDWPFSLLYEHNKVLEHGCTLVDGRGCYTVFSARGLLPGKKGYSIYCETKAGFRFYIDAKPQNESDFVMYKNEFVKTKAIRNVDIMLNKRKLGFSIGDIGYNLSFSTQVTPESEMTPDELDEMVEIFYEIATNIITQSRV